MQLARNIRRLVDKRQKGKLRKKAARNKFVARWKSVDSGLPFNIMIGLTSIDTRTCPIRKPKKEHKTTMRSSASLLRAKSP